MLTLESRDIIGRSAKDQSSSRMMFMLFDIDDLVGWIRDKKKLPKATRDVLKAIGRKYLSMDPDH